MLTLTGGGGTTGRLLALTLCLFICAGRVPGKCHVHAGGVCLFTSSRSGKWRGGRADMHYCGMSACPHVRMSACPYPRAAPPRLGSPSGRADRGESVRGSLRSRRKRFIYHLTKEFREIRVWHHSQFQVGVSSIITPWHTTSDSTCEWEAVGVGVTHLTHILTNDLPPTTHTAAQDQLELLSSITQVTSSQKQQVRNISHLPSPNPLTHPPTNPSITEPTITNRDPTDHRIFEQSSSNIWSSLSLCSHRCLQSSSINPSSIKGISFDATCSLVVVNQHGSPVCVTRGDNLGRIGGIESERNIILWADHRAEDEADLINSTGEGVLEFVGGAMSVSFPIFSFFFGLFFFLFSFFPFPKKTTLNAHHRLHHPSHWI